jgi:hypothetical protein
MNHKTLHDTLCRVPIRCSMGTHMKTTIEIADALMAEARRLMVHEQRTLRSLIEEGLRLLLKERRGGNRKVYTFQPVVFRGEGLQPGIDPGNWEQIADLIYRGRGT